MSATQAPGRAFKTDYIQPFVDSIDTLFVQHLGGTVERATLRINPTGHPAYEISGVIAFSGAILGRAVLSFPREVAERVVTAYLKLSPLPEGVLADCVGELTNIVVGRAKSSLERLQIVIAPPTVIDGTNYRINIEQNATCISVPFISSFGALQLDVSLMENGAFGQKLD